MSPDLADRLAVALDARRDLLAAPQHDAALRLFNGFTEGDPSLVLDCYATTLLIHDHTDVPLDGTSPSPRLDAIVGLVREHLPWLRAGVVKRRRSHDPAGRRGQLCFGEAADTTVREHDVAYAVDLTMNRDASFYIDTRHLRRWLVDHSRGRRVLNTFAYTGSIGIAARAGGAIEVVQLDHNERFLALARRSCALNSWPEDATTPLVGNFFPAISNLKRTGRRFDCVVLDPPFFTTTAQGTVDLARDTIRLINKVRPLIDDGGHLIAINNALFLSGRDYLSALEQLCSDGYLSIEALISIPDDCTGYPHTRVSALPVDPAPFNHATKIAVLKVRRKT